MSTYNTGNPLGSTDKRDLFDNAENLDSAVNSDQSVWVDRLGKTRRTLSSIESTYDDALVNVGEYQAGITITSKNQIISDSDNFWRVSSSTTLPYTTTGTGMPEDGAFVSVGDAVLRQDLAAPGGAGLVGNGGIVFDAVMPHPVDGPDPELSYLTEVTWLTVGQKVRTLGYYTTGDGGGNDYEIVSGGTGSVDGGSFIDLSGSGLQAKGLFVGRIVTPEMFGAISDGVNDDISAFNSIREWNDNAAVEIISKYLVSNSVQNKILRGGNKDLNGFIRDPNSNISVLSYVNASGVDISGFSIDGNSGGQHGLRFDNCDGVRADNLKIHDTNGYGVGAQGFGYHKNYKLSNIDIYRSGIDGVDIKNRAFANENITLENVTVTDPGIISTSQAGIDLRGKVKLINCHVLFTDNNGTLVSKASTDGIRARASSGEQDGAEGSSLTNCSVKVSDTVLTKTRHGFAVECGRVKISNCDAEDMTTALRVYGDGVSTKPNEGSIIANFQSFGCSNGVEDSGINTKMVNINCYDSSNESFRLNGADSPTLVACESHNSATGFRELNGTSGARYIAAKSNGDTVSSNGVTGVRISCSGLPSENENADIRPAGGGYVATNIGSVPSYNDDAAAAAGGVPVGAFYRTGSTLKIRAS